MPELLKLVEALSVDICRVSIGELAEFIEKDGVVLTRILSVANKLAHNPGVAPITSLEQAIHQIGFNRVRNIAVSLMLLDKSSGSSAPEQREAAALTLAVPLIGPSSRYTAPRSLNTPVAPTRISSSPSASASGTTATL